MLFVFVFRNIICIWSFWIAEYYSHMVFVFVIRIRAKMWTQIIFVFGFPNTYSHIVICSGNFDCITWGIFCITCVHCLELGWVALHWSCSGPVAWEEKCGLGGKMWPGRSENVKKFSLNLSWCIIHSCKSSCQSKQPDQRVTVKYCTKQGRARPGMSTCQCL